MGHQESEIEDHDRGLSHDLPIVLSRRRTLSVVGGAGLVAALAGCGSTTSPSAAGPNPGGSSFSDGEIPEETTGPYPGDGSNGVNVLTESGIVRSDITSSFGSASGVAEGVPLTVKLKVVEPGNGAKPLKGAAVYLWHCNIDGKYSLYSDSVTEENYLRGVQETDADGAVTFTSIFPRRTPDVGRTFTLRCTRVSTTPRQRQENCARHKSPCQNKPARWFTPPMATARASKTWRRRRWTPTWCSGMAIPCSWQK